MGISPAPANEAVNPLFAWTDNWINTFDSDKEDMVVRVTPATHFTVLIYGIDELRSMADKMTAAVCNTLLAFSMNPAMIDACFLQAGELVFTSNHDRELTSWVNR